MRMKLAWMVNTRPDVAVDISQLAQITEDTYGNDSKYAVKRFNSAITYANANLLHIKYPQMDLESICIVGYSDAAFANNSDLTTQPGRAILLVNKDGIAMPISYKSYKSRHVTRSVLAAEVSSFAEMFDDAFTIRSQLQQAMRKDVVMHLLTDSKISLRYYQQELTN